MIPDAALRILTGFALVVFLVTAALGVYAFLFTELGVGRKGRWLWRFGLAVVGLSVATVGGTVLLHFARLAGL